MCMKNHAYVPEPLVLAVANQRHGTHRALLELSKRRLLCYESAGRGGICTFLLFFLFLAIVYQVGRSDLFFRLTEFYIIVAFCHISSNPLR